jgi:aminoglycoside 6-adenylyltransferase
VEDVEQVTDCILEWAGGDSRIAAVVLTGSRGRGQRVDRFSDLDVELIGPRPRDLAADDDWIACVGQAMVVLPFDLDDLTSRLVVLPKGRKVDFTLWPEDRIARMVESGLTDLYERGYTVLMDKTGLTSALPRPSGRLPIPAMPTQREFSRLESEFWFEATQVAVYLIRADLWVVKFRENTMHQCLLRMLEWRVQSDPAQRRFTWHIGHHMDEWLAAADYAMAGQVFTHFDAPDTIRGITAAMNLFERATASAAANLSFIHRPELAAAARSHVLSLLNPVS